MATRQGSGGRVRLLLNLLQPACCPKAASWTYLPWVFGKVMAGDKVDVWKEESPWLTGSQWCISPLDSMHVFGVAFNAQYEVLSAMLSHHT